MNNSTKICLTRAPKNKKQKDIFTYLSLFSGIGGFELGIQQSMPYAKCVGFSETNPYAKSIYQSCLKQSFLCTDKYLFIFFYANFSTASILLSILRIKGKKGFFWSCKGYFDEPKCEFMTQDKAGKPVLKY
jgi:site-specific DNA-cytosine methylase